MDESDAAGVGEGLEEGAGEFEGAAVAFDGVDVAGAGVEAHAGEDEVLAGADIDDGEAGGELIDGGAVDVVAPVIEGHGGVDEFVVEGVGADGGVDSVAEGGQPAGRAERFFERRRGFATGRRWALRGKNQFYLATE